MCKLKEYKLIKGYPGSPQLGSVVIWTTYSHALPRYLLAQSESVSYTREEIEKFPEFWEEIKPKEWEILSFLGTTKGWNKGEVFYSGMPYSEKELLEDRGMLIHSVKRLSDGEVFTVGDKIEYQHGQQKGTVLGFDKNPISETLLMIISSNTISGRHRIAWYGECSSPVYLAKIKPLFVTEDGVEIFDGDKREIWWVQLDEHSGSCIGPCRGTEFGTVNSNVGKNKFSRYFSTKEAADKWILWNKPQFSLNGLVEAANKKSELLRRRVKRYLEKVVR